MPETIANLFQEIMCYCNNNNHHNKWLGLYRKVTKENKEKKYLHFEIILDYISMFSYWILRGDNTTGKILLWHSRNDNKRIGDWLYLLSINSIRKVVEKIRIIIYSNNKKENNISLKWTIFFPYFYIVFNFLFTKFVTCYHN